MPQAVFWDFGGVLTTSPFAAFATFERQHGLPEGFLRTVNSHNLNTNAWAQLERGEIDLAGFEQVYRAETAAFGHPLSGRAVLGLLYGELQPAMVAALRRCREHFRTACLTNNMPLPDTPDDPLVQQRDRIFEPVRPLFDYVFESSLMGLRKPDPAFFQHACQAMSLPAAEVVFLDDLGVNLKPARTLGMTTIKVESPAQALPQLEAVLGIALVDCLHTHPNNV